jgi:hypothetical protein
MGIILKYIERKYGSKSWNVFISTKRVSSGGFFEHGNEPPGSVKGGKFLDELTDI